MLWFVGGLGATLLTYLVDIPHVIAYGAMITGLIRFFHGAAVALGFAEKIANKWH
jgi:hypothetical protein